jgi:hypothetical protein
MTGIAKTLIGAGMRARLVRFGPTSQKGPEGGGQTCRM